MRNALRWWSLSIGLWALAEGTHAIVIPVDCGGMRVASIEVDIAPGPGVTGRLLANAPRFATLTAAATQCGEHHFNWYQIVSADNTPPVDAARNRLTAPYVDLPPGGYGNDPSTADDDRQWGDRLPWYWDEGADPPAGTPGFEADLNIADKTTATALRYSDFPGGLDGTMVTFRTWLVSLNVNGSFHSFHDGFTWMYSDPAGAAGPSIMGLAGIGAGIHPTRAQYQDLIGGFAARIPEPGLLALIGIGLVILGCGRRCVDRNISRHGRGGEDDTTTGLRNLRIARWKSS